MTDAAAATATAAQPAASAAAAGSPAATSATSATTATAQQSGATQAAPAATATQPAAEPAYNLKAPEGFDPAGIPKMIELAKKFDIPPAKAQALLEETHARQVQAKKDHEAAKAKLDAENLEAIRADKDYGGEKLQASLNRAQQVVEKLEARVPGLKAKLDGAMNDPVVVRLFNVLGDGMKEDSFATGGKTDGPQDLGTRIFGPNPFKGA